MARRDPWVNMLRTTIACAGAALGGADAVTVLPFTWALGRPDAFARRIARNTHLVLQEESSLGRVIGSGARRLVHREDHATSWRRRAGRCSRRSRPKAAWAPRWRADSSRARSPGRRRGAGRRHRYRSPGADRRLGLPAPRRRRRQGRPAPSSRPDRQGRHLGRAAAAAAPGRAVRAAARRCRCPPGRDRQASPGVPRLPRRSRRILGPRDLGQEFSRRRRHRGHRRRQPSQLRRRGQGLRRERGKPCLHLLLRHGLCRAGEATAGALKAAGAAQVLLAGRPKAQEAALQAAGVDTFIFAGGNALDNPCAYLRCTRHTPRVAAIGKDWVGG